MASSLRRNSSSTQSKGKASHRGSAQLSERDSSARSASFNYIYLLRYSRIPVYVGMTRDSIYARLSWHIKEHSNVGAAIIADRGRGFLGWSVQLIQIEGEIEAAERHYIRRIHPPMNIEENNNSQEHVTSTVRIFNRNFRPDTYARYRRSTHKFKRRLRKKPGRIF